MPEFLRIRRSVPPLIVAGGVALAVAAGVVPAALLLAAAFVASHAITIPDRSERRLALSPMVALAAFLLADGAIAPLVAGAAIGMPAGWQVMRTLRGDRALDHVLPGDPTAFLAALGAFCGLHVLVPGTGLPTDLADVVPAGAASLAWYVTVLGIRSAAPGRRRTAVRVMAWQVLRDGPAYAVLFSGGAMFGLVWPALGWWAVPIAALPYGFSHLSLHRQGTAGRTYRETIVALARIPEAGGLVGQGRGERTGSLAAAVAAEARLSPRDVERVEYAGLLHDVGRVVFSDPAVAEGGYTDADVAAWGATIIQESPYLAPVAQLVADQHKPFRRPGEARNELVPKAAQVVRVSAAYDRSLHEHGKTVPEALEDLHRGAAYDYDPEVVAALRRVLRRRGVPGA
ncbi:MAG: HD domain-containing protein [Actinobacteria bacterium]|nr:HD domain-containing protein [Actinomycetota bacterium]